MGILSAGKYWFVNDRYEIWKDTGVIYDTEQADDIPQSIFGIRDRLMKYNREGVTA
jgi:hypothetical protein